MENFSGIDFGDGPPPFILFSNPTIVIFFYRYVLSLIFLLGFTGNIASMMTFLRPILRTTSTGFLFFILAVSDSFYLLIFIYDYIEVGLIERPLFITFYGDLCRFRWFIKGFFQFFSGWILVLIAVDRWLRARVPFKVNSICTRRNTIIALCLLVIFGCSLHCQLLLPSIFGSLTPGIANEACGPIYPFSPYADFYFGRWPIVQAVLNCLIPVSTMLASGLDIYRIIRREKQRIQPSALNQTRRQRQERIQAQMLILTITSVLIFFITALPISIRRIFGAYQIAVFKMTNIFDLVVHNGILTVLASLNYAINFYVHCLASKLFRQEFLRSIKMGQETSDKKIRTLTAQNQQRTGLVASTTHRMPTIA